MRMPSKDIKMHIYRRVRDLREDHDKTQKEIAEMLNIKYLFLRR